MKNTAHSSPCITPLPNPLHIIKKALIKACRDRRFVKAINSESVITAIPGDAFAALSGDYFITGDQGIFAIKNRTLLRLFGVRTYGIAIQGEHLFAASSNDHYSSILKARLPDTIAPGESLRFSEILRIASNKRGRIHQIAFFGGRLAVTYTYANTILLLDPNSGEVLSECSPFRDQFGQPILGDHNHINSVSQCGDSLLFCAYRAGTGSLIGVIHGDCVKGYAVNRVGVHDVHVTDNRLYYSDTFGDIGGESVDGCGFLMENGRPVDERYFSRPPGWAIRGIARTDDELIVGHSHKGARSKRYDGNGGLFRIINGKVVNEIAVPFAQVYDLIRFDGYHFEEPSHLRNFEEINAFLCTILGPCVYESRLDSETVIASSMAST